MADKIKNRTLFFFFLPAVWYICEIPAVNHFLVAGDLTFKPPPTRVVLKDYSTSLMGFVFVAWF